MTTPSPTPRVPQSRATGFTIVELIIVIVVIAILAAITIVTYNGIQTRAKDASLSTDAENLEKKLQIAATTNGGVYDSSLNWNSNDGPDSALGNFTASNGATIITTINSDGTGYCIRAYSKSSSYSNLASALTRGDCSVTLLGVGAAHACAIAAQDAVYCWGDDTYGQLGNNSTNASLLPTAASTAGVLSTKAIKAVSLGYQTSCALSWDGIAYCWGDNTYGQLGNGTTTSSLVPVTVTMTGALAGKTIKAITGGAPVGCAIASDNNAYCWGSNNSGALGNGSVISQSLVPVGVSTTGVLAGKTVKAIGASASGACVIASDSNAYCWGSGLALGNGSSTDSGLPVAVSTSGVLSGKSLKAISVGNSFACAIASDNNAYCWGSNGGGALGNGSTTNSSVPVAVTTSGALGGKSIKAISAGLGGSSCAIASDNNAYCWGSNYAGQLGNGTTNDSSVPVRATLPQNQ